VGQARRLLSLAAVLDGQNRKVAAEIGAMDRQTLRDWVHRFNEKGPEGLVNGKAPGSADQPLHVRMKAAIAALPFEHPKLAVTVAIDGDQSLAARMERCIARTNKVIEARVLEEARALNARVADSEAAAVSAAASRQPLVSYRRR
jgi:hypothetical protein